MVLPSFLLETFEKGRGPEFLNKLKHNVESALRYRCLSVVLVQLPHSKILQA